MTTTMVENIESFNKVQEHNKAMNGTYLGSILSWKIESNTLVDENKLWDNLAYYQIPSYLHPKQIKPLSAFRKAVAKTNKSIKKENLMLRYITREEGADGLWLGLVEENKRISLKELEYDNLGTIVYSNNVIDSSLSPTSTVLNEIHRWFNFYKSYTNEDISSMLVQFANTEGIRLTPRGGSYFLPAEEASTVKNFKQMVSKINFANQLYSLDIYSTGSGKEDLAEIAENNLEREIEELLKESMNFLAAADPKRATYQKGIDSRTNELKLITKKLNNLKKVIDFKTENIEHTMNKLNALLEQKETTAILSNENNNVSPQELDKAKNNSLNLVDEAGF